MQNEIPGRCRNCKFFEPPSDSDEHIGICKLTRTNSRKGYGDHRESMAFAQNNGDHIGWLEVLPDFGCVQFQKR
ncbi:MAG: hypothetical protein JWO13_2240 [Acidobacteriales bacterium]|nr:hypothetical protein [Terriglobales bacterium]